MLNPNADFEDVIYDIEMTLLNLTKNSNLVDHIIRVCQPMWRTKLEDGVLEPKAEIDEIITTLNDWDFKEWVW